MHKCEDNIEIILTNIGREGVDRIHLAQDKSRWRPLELMLMKFKCKVSLRLTKHQAMKTY
jgi:hypothetical protein